jgi:GH15 family glucan-1,4-alpha-glucosidase
VRYGLIGNCKTAALVHENGSIDWCCLPNFDSPSAFASLLDPGGGRFAVRLKGGTKTRQSYLPETNILQTEFDDGQNAFVAIDFMPRYREGEAYRYPVEIHRLLKPLRGNPEIEVVFEPKLNYALGETRTESAAGAIRAVNGLEDLFLYSSLDPESLLASQPIALKKDEFLLLAYHEKIVPPTIGYSLELFEKTKAYWEGWSRSCRLPALYPDAVLRSALVLKLLTFEETGAIIAAPTSSLPEIVGESRNWDYRYCWMRDSSLMLESLKSIGHFKEARAFIHFLLRIFESKQTEVQIVYGIDGRKDLTERTLSYWRGYKDSRPVRIGNAACETRQNDIFGEMLNTIYLHYFYYEFAPMTDDVWSLVRFLVNTVVKEWSLRDAGIWEFRRRKAHFTFSKVLSWVAVQSGAKIAKRLGKTHAAERWLGIAEKIRRDIEKKAWNPKIGAFTQAYGSDTLDASLLLMNRYGFLAKDDPRWISTVRKCEESLIRNGFVFRYVSEDEFGWPKTALVACSLWMVKALTSIGEREKAVRLFENVLAHANHLGLLSEDFDPETGSLTGNFPQSYSHMAVINAAHLLSQG